MKTLILLGPPGSGKTTLVRQILQEGWLKGKVAFVFNDGGSTDTVDAGVLANLADFRPMTGGCFGCRDANDLRDLLLRLKAEGYAWSVIEPYGFIDGEELPALCASMGMRAEVITLVDIQHWRKNHQLLSQVVVSQLQAATIAVGLTKYPKDTNEMDDIRLDEPLREIAQHAPGVFAGFIPEDQPATWLQERLNKRPTLSVVRHTCSHARCEHDHYHASELNHGLHVYSYRLRPKTTYHDLERLFQDERIIRLKGVVEGKQVHVVHGIVKRGVCDMSHPFVTFYALSPIDVSEVAHLVEKIDGSRPEQSTQARLRSTEALSEKDVNEVVVDLLARVPIGPVMTPTGPETNPELHELLNELRKRPGVHPELNARAIRARLGYYLAVLSVFHPDASTWNLPGAAKRKRDLAIGIAWFAYYKPDELGDELVARAKAAPIHPLLVEGLLGLERHNENLTRALTIAEETADTVRFIGRIDAPLTFALDHAVELAERDGRPEVLVAWQKVRSIR